MILDKFSRISRLTGQLTSRKFDLFPRTSSFSHRIYNPHCLSKKHVASISYNQARYQSSFSNVKYMQAEAQVSVKDNLYVEQQLVGSNILEASEVYANCVPRPMKFDESLVVDNLEELLDKSWISMSNSEIVENFERLSHYAFKYKESIEDETFRGILDVLKSRFTDFSDSDICHLFKCLQLWNVDKTKPVFEDLWKTFDDELLKRYKDWTIDEILLMCHLYYKLRISRPSEFTWHSLKKIGRKPQNMNYTQLIHFTFLMKMNRRLPINLYNIEYYVEQQMDKLTLNDAGIFATAFCQYETVIKSPNFFDKIIDKLIAEIDTVNEIYLCNLLSIIRLNPSINGKYLKLLGEIERILARLSLNTCATLAVTLRKTLVDDKTLMAKLMERFEKEIKNLKIKQMDALMLTLFTFGYDPKTSYCSTVFRELQEPSRAEEIAKYSKTFVAITHCALSMNIFTKDVETICRKIFDREFIDNYCKNDYFYLNREYLEMHYCLELDHPEYNGPKLDEPMIEFLCKAFGSYKTKNFLKRPESKTLDGMLLNSIEKICRKALKSESAFYREAILPHFFKAFGVICYDPETKEYGSPEEKLSKIPWNLPKYAPADGKKWFALVTGPIHQVTNNNKKPLGKILMQMRHLENMGFEPIFIPYNEWDALSDNEKEKYILDRLHR